MVGMEPLEIDPVVDDRDPRRVDRIVGHDLVADACRDGEHASARARRELPPLEPEDGAVIRTPDLRSLPRPLHPLEIRPMRAAADADDVLPQCAPEADDHVPPLARRRPRRGHGEGQQPDDPASTYDRNAPDVHAWRAASARGDEGMHLVPAGREARRHAAEVRLRPAAREPSMQEGDPHHRARRVSPNARSRYPTCPGARRTAPASAVRAPGTSPAARRIAASVAQRRAWRRRKAAGPTATSASG